MTIEKESLLGILEWISDEDEVGELKVNEMTVNIQNQPDMFKQKYLDLSLKHKREMERRYILTKPSQDHGDKTEKEIEIEEEEAPPGEEPIRREEGQEDQWITSKLRNVLSQWSNPSQIFN